ncbi:fatty acid desaturase family protein [Promicromonospora thailandica]|uniref:Fatty acid desaturase n=1 Tax=Promicromonospora thailandica TaxID=765201 RepID=A0A9X2G4X8_9MICO|nr:acyl-CoA desaturase [Promicromonospora thailandica]MCP2265392.1 Fatty acid desaturase [Promicromonospora thailandica]BFF16930.1 acyl-CoA desaturase [Promicromonospora thailandica]
MTTTEAPPRPARQRRTARNAQTNDYFDLVERANAAGLMGRRAGWYVGRTAVVAGALALAFVLLLTLGQTWWQLAVAAFFGVVFTQAAFLAHDGGHMQVFANGRRNEWFSRIIGNLVVGLSIGWWNRKHNRHHGHPNVIGKDGDIDTGALVFVPGEEVGRTGFLGWVTRRQGWLFFPMLALFGPVLHANSVQTLATVPGIKHRVWESVLLGVRLIGFPVLVVLTLGPALGLSFLAVQLVVFGVYMGATFAPNHKGMPLLPKDNTVDFLRRQVLTSRNIRGGRFVEYAMGGLNYQVEHHVFPRMPSVNLRHARPIVQAFCAEKNIPYTETGLMESYQIIVEYLNRVGLGYADPMDCPIAAQYR